MAKGALSSKRRRKGLSSPFKLYIQPGVRISGEGIMTASAAGIHESSVEAFRNRGLVRAWLYLVALMIFAMVVVGGATRLTDSGLSITEWQPIHGAIPPLSEAEWQEEFEKYQQIPEYQYVNKGMSLDAFKAIYWWEWAHRLLGRLIGFVVAVPLVFFWATGRLEGWLKPRLVGLFLLGGAQGAIGWWMVASGLAERVDVSQYRLATHLTLACILFAYTVWLAESVSTRDNAAEAGASARPFAWAMLIAIFIQIYFGALVAGLDAGMAYNTWPLMDGSVIPSGLLALEPAWRNFFESGLTVQFQHRVFAYLLLILALWQGHVAFWRPFEASAKRRALLILVVALAQAAVGIATLLYVVPLDIALTHQAGAIILLGLAVIHLRRLYPARLF